MSLTHKEFDQTVASTDCSYMYSILIISLFLENTLPVSQGYMHEYSAELVMF